MPPTCSKDTDGQHPQNLDLTMVESTTTFGNTNVMNDLAGVSVTPPPCVASVPIPSDLDKAIKEDLKASSGILSDSDRATYVPTTRPIDIRGD